MLFCITLLSTKNAISSINGNKRKEIQKKSFCLTSINIDVKSLGEYKQFVFDFYLYLKEVSTQPDIVSNKPFSSCKGYSRGYVSHVSHD